jgi:hypothetical protein
MPTPFFERPSVSLSDTQREQINTGILKLIRAGQNPERPRVFSAYTGRGGLHQLDYSQFENRSQYTQAKHAIEEGQFFTPDSVVEFAAKILNPPPGSIVCDPTSGHGAWLNWFRDCRLFGNDTDAEATIVALYIFPDAQIETTDQRL